MTVQPAGNFFLVAVHGDVGKAIEFGEWVNGDGFGPYAHAGMALSNGELIEAEPGGARRRPQSEYDGTNIIWSSWDLPDATRNLLDVKSRARESVPYSALDYGALFAHRLHIPVPGLRRYIASTGHQICSQLVDQIYQDAGLQIFRDGRWPGYVTPMALFPALHGPVTR